MISLYGIHHYFTRFTIQQNSEWQQVSSSLHDSSQYSVQSQQWCCLDGLHSSNYFQVLQSLFQLFGDIIKRTNYNWYQRHFYAP